jgi:hypothetical protein
MEKKIFLCGRNAFKEKFLNEKRGNKETILLWEIPVIKQGRDTGETYKYQNFKTQNEDLYVRIELCFNGGVFVEADEVIVLENPKADWLTTFIIDKLIEVTSVSDEYVRIPKSYFKRLLKIKYN